VPLARQAWGANPLIAECTARIAGHLYGLYIDNEHLIEGVIRNSLLAYRRAIECNENTTEVYMVNLLVESSKVFQYEFTYEDAKGRAHKWGPLASSYHDFLSRSNGLKIKVSVVDTDHDNIKNAVLLSGATMPLMVTNLLSQKLVAPTMSSRGRKHARA